VLFSIQTQVLGTRGGLFSKCASCERFFGRAKIQSGQHIEAHYVTAVFGDTFPPYLECSDNVCFELALSVVHVNADLGALLDQ
jgi:hypothetical protein